MRLSWALPSIALLGTLVAALACDKEPEPAPEVEPPRDLAGNVVDPFAGSPHATILFFVDTQCPISNRYAPTVERVHRTWAARGVRSFLVYPGRRETVDEIRAHLRDYHYTLPAVRDPGHVLVARAGAHRTPEVAVFRSEGSVAYVGRIDDRYVAFGQARPEPTRNDLEEALRAVLDGREVAVPRTEAVGCEIVMSMPPNAN